MNVRDNSYRHDLPGGDVAAVVVCMRNRVWMYSSGTLVLFRDVASPIDNNAMLPTLFQPAPYPGVAVLDPSLRKHISGGFNG